MPFGQLFKNVGQLAGRAAPVLGAAAALSGGGQAATLAKFGTAARILGGTEQGQRTAVDQPQAPPAETAMSGEAGQTPLAVQTTTQPSGGIVPAMYVPPTQYANRAQQASLPAIIQGGRAVGTMGGRAMGLLGLGAGAISLAPMIIDPFTGEEKKLRVTRKLRSQVKKAVEMFGIEFVAEQMGTDVEIIVYILTKKMRNDGPYVTKAAVRKTRQTVRKMKNLCDMYDDLRPAAKRRAPARAASRTRVVNVK